MEDLIQCIRTALADAATPEQKQAAAAACCQLYAAFSPPPGVPISVPHAPPRPILHIDQALDLAIAKLRSMLPTDTTVSTSSVQFPFLGEGKGP